MPRPLNLSRLTDRQRQIAELAQQGLTNKAIADQLQISRRTVEKHLCDVYRTLRLKDNQTAREKLGRGNGNGENK